MLEFLAYKLRIHMYMCTRAPYVLLALIAPSRRQRTCNSLRPDGVETELTTVKRTRNTTTTVQRQSRARAAAAAEALHPDSLPVSVCRCVLLQPQSQSLSRCPLSLSGYLSLSPSLTIVRIFHCAFAFAFVRRAKRHVNWLLVVRATATTTTSTTTKPPQSPSSSVVVSTCP